MYWFKHSEIDVQSSQGILEYFKQSGNDCKKTLGKKMNTINYKIANLQSKTHFT